MKIDLQKEGHVLIIRPVIDIINASISHEFRNKMVELIDQGNHFFLLNMSKVNFIDSSGLGVMIFLLKTLKMNKGTISICELNGTISNLFKITRMDQIFDLRPNEQEALDFLLTKNNVESVNTKRNY